MTISIKMVNDDVVAWEVTPDMEYDFEGEFFVVKKKGKWVGIYAKDRILSIEVR